PLEVSVDSLTTDTSVGGGNQFITEANGLTALNLNAGAGNASLTLTAGSLGDTDAATDITANAATVTLNDLTPQNVGAALNPIGTSVNDLTVSTAAGNGNIFVTEANGLTALNLNAGAGNVSLTLALGAISDLD